jgi:hypothetical protein
MAEHLVSAGRLGPSITRIEAAGGKDMSNAGRAQAESGHELISGRTVRQVLSTAQFVAGQHLARNTDLLLKRETMRPSRAVHGASAPKQEQQTDANKIHHRHGRR